MQKLLLTDYILGNAVSEKYKGTFIEECPWYIHSLPEIVFVRDEFGNYQFKENNEIYKPFINMSYFNRSLGNFFIIFQKWMKEPKNIIQTKNHDYYNDFVYREELSCYIKLNNIKDEEDDVIKDCFVMVNPEFSEIVIVYFYGDNNKVGHLRTNFTNILLGNGVRDYDKKVLGIVQYYINNKHKFKAEKDNVKLKYKDRFTSQEYIVLK